MSIVSGKATLKKHGKAHFATIGQLGNQAQEEKYGSQLPEVKRKAGKASQQLQRKKYGKTYKAEMARRALLMREAKLRKQRLDK